MKRGYYELTQFTCPVCGSHEFGTSGKVGCCHGYTRQADGTTQPCRYTWHRGLADAAVFKGTGEYRPRIVEARGFPRTLRK